MNLVVGTLPILGRAARVLVDPSASLCFASEEFYESLSRHTSAKHCDVMIDLLSSDYMRSFGYLEGVIVEVQGHQLPARLYALQLCDFHDSKEKSDDSDDEAMLSRKLQIIFAKKKKFGSRKFFKKEKKKEPTCYECNQPGHYKSECSRLKKKDQAEKSEKKKGKEKRFKKFKKKAMAATWDNEDATSSDSSSSESEQEEKANLALMARLEQMASPRAQVSVQLTSDQLQRLAKNPICSGKSVEFSHLSGNLAWVEETLTTMGWTKLCQISEPFVASAVRSFYASLKVSTGNTVVGYVKGTKITISEEYLVELLDCPNSSHCLSEFIPLEKQKLGIIGSLGTLCKRGLQVNELSAEKRLIHSIIFNIITPSAGTHSSITARDENLIFWAIQRHRVNLPVVILERMIAVKDLQESLPYGSLLTMIFKKLSVDLSGDVPMSTKEKIGLITLRRSHYSLVGMKQNLWYKDSVPECEYEVYLDEPLVSLLTQDIPTSSIQIKAPPVPTIPNVFVQPPEPIVEQVGQPVIPPEVPSEDAQLLASSSLPEQDAPSEIVHKVLRDLRGKGILSEDVPVSPMEHIFEEKSPPTPHLSLRLDQGLRGRVATVLAPF
ncbi:hypothetical protein Taro_031628 [Colocasia esculenta]|uniref:CCHC-type domain-containing protein n=1 Tax=Colocasia esculenta TaxID=4460 RepID=A0A843VJA2_COLES|nr:hypothetical protein [Colocasia esculenta]